MALSTSSVNKAFAGKAFTSAQKPTLPCTRVSLSASQGITGPQHPPLENLGQRYNPRLLQSLGSESAWALVGTRTLPVIGFTCDAFRTDGCT